MSIRLKSFSLGTAVAWVLALTLAFSDAPTFAKLLGFIVILKGDFNFSRD